MLNWLIISFSYCLRGFPDLRSVWHKLFKHVAKTTVVIIFHRLGYDLSWNKLNNNYEFLDGEFLINVQISSFPTWDEITFLKFQDKNVVFVYAAWLTHPTRAWAIRVRIAALTKTTHFLLFLFLNIIIYRRC